MATRAQLGDRRAYLRFNRGEFWASLGRVEQVVVRNVSLSGALIEVPGRLQSMRIAHVALPDHGPVVDAVVRHAAPAPNELQEDRFLIGLEFVSPSTLFVEAVEHLVDRVATPHLPHFSE